MKKNLKYVVFLLVVIISFIGSRKLIEYIDRVKAEKTEIAEMVFMRLDEVPENFSSTKDSLNWALSVDQEVMLRYFYDLNPEKYHLKADSIAALLKSENLKRSLFVLEKSRGLEKAAEFVYDKYKFDYKENYKNIDNLEVNINNWNDLFRRHKVAFTYRLDSALSKLAEENKDILWLSFQFKYIDFVPKLDYSPEQLVAYAFYRYATENVSIIIDEISTKTLSEDCRLGKLLSPKRYEEVIAYLEKVNPIKALNYLICSNAEKSEFKKVFFNNLANICHDNIVFYYSAGMINEKDVRKYLLSMTCERLTADTSSIVGLPAFCKIHGIADYGFIVLESIKSKRDIHLAEIFFNNHPDLYGNRKFLYKALGEKWDSFK